MSSNTAFVSKKRCSILHMSVAKLDADKLSIAYIPKLEWLLLSVSFIGMLSSTILVKFSSIIVELSNSMMCVLSF